MGLGTGPRWRKTAEAPAAERYAPPGLQKVGIPPQLRLPGASARSSAARRAAGLPDPRLRDYWGRPQPSVADHLQAKFFPSPALPNHRSGPTARRTQRARQTSKNPNYRLVIQNLLADMRIRMAAPPALNPTEARLWHHRKERAHHALPPRRPEPPPTSPGITWAILVFIPPRVRTRTETPSDSTGPASASASASTDAGPELKQSAPRSCREARGAAVPRLAILCSARSRHRTAAGRSVQAKAPDGGFARARIVCPVRVTIVRPLRW